MSPDPSEVVHALAGPSWRIANGRTRRGPRVDDAAAQGNYRRSFVASITRGVLAYLVSRDCPMRHCHNCGVEVRDGGHRRVVQTGATRRVYYGKRRTSVTRATSEGPRTLCASCAKLHDRQAAFGLVVRLIVFGVVVTVLGTAYVRGPQKSGEPVAAIQQVGAPPLSSPQASEAPLTIGSIDAPRRMWPLPLCR